MTLTQWFDTFMPDVWSIGYSEGYQGKPLRADFATALLRGEYKSAYFDGMLDRACNNIITK